MGDQLARAEDFENKAEKKLSGWGMFGSKFEDAAELFDKSANSYKLAKSCNLFQLFFHFIYLLHLVHHNACVLRLLQFMQLTTMLVILNYYINRYT